jgi:hypothetical protein
MPHQFREHVTQRTLRPFSVLKFLKKVTLSKRSRRHVSEQSARRHIWEWTLPACGSRRWRERDVHVGIERPLADCHRRTTEVKARLDATKAKGQEVARLAEL